MYTRKVVKNISITSSKGVNVENDTPVYYVL